MLTRPAARSGSGLFWLALATIYLVWGSTYIAIRVMVETVPPLLGAGLRFFLAGVVFLAVVTVRGRRVPLAVAGRQLAACALVGTLLLFGGNGLITIAEQDVPSGLAALVIASMPLWVIVLRVLARERVGWPTLGGVALGFLGVAMLVLPGDRPGAAPLWGVLLLLVAAALWATGSFLSTRVGLPADPLVSTSLQMLSAGGLMLACGLGPGKARRFIRPRSRPDRCSPSRT